MALSDSQIQAISNVFDAKATETVSAPTTENIQDLLQVSGFLEQLPDEISTGDSSLAAISSSAVADSSSASEDSSSVASANSSAVSSDTSTTPASSSAVSSDASEMSAS